MDENLLASGGVGASIMLAFGILYKVIQAVNHRRIKSTCMGKELTASLDIETTSPKKNSEVSVDVAERTRDTSHPVGGTARGQEVQEAAS